MGAIFLLKTYHFVDGLDNLKHLVVADFTISVNVVQLEGPVQLILRLSSARDTQGADEFLEVDAARPVAVEDVEDIVGKCAGVTKREELAVDFLKLLLGEGA